MTKAALGRYHARMQRVLDHIDRHLDEDLGLDALSDVAAFSKHHFHRQFGALFGVPVHRYVQLVRMKRASWQLAFRADMGVTEIALDACYEAPEAFARAFRQRFGQAPSAFRKAPGWEPWLSALGPLTQARSQYMPTYAAEDVAMIDFPATPVAVMEHRGDPARIGDTIQRFIAWRKRQPGLRPAASATYNIFHADPRSTPPEDFRLDLCVATDRVFPAGQGVEAGLIPAGRCAMLRVAGSSDDLEPAALFLYRDWLPVSGEEPGDFPLFCRRVRFFPDVPEHEAVTELYLPLA